MFLKFEEHSGQKALVFEEVDVSSDDSEFLFRKIHLHPNLGILLSLLPIMMTNMTSL